MSRNVVRCLTLVVLISACRAEDTVSPNSLLGTYFLEQANSAPLPLLLSASAPWRYSLVAESLTFDGDGRVARARIIREENSATGKISTITSSLGLQYRVGRRTVEIGSFTPCPANALCVGNDTGVVTGETISLVSNSYNRAQLTYRWMHIDPP
jgi:hypothetical protein